MTSGQMEGAVIQQSGRNEIMRKIYCEGQFYGSRCAAVTVINQEVCNKWDCNTFRRIL